MINRISVKLYLHCKTKVISCEQFLNALSSAVSDQHHKPAAYRNKINKTTGLCKIQIDKD